MADHDAYELLEWAEKEEGELEDDRPKDSSVVIPSFFLS